MFAYLGNYPKSGEEANKIQKTIGVKISTSRRKTHWYNFKYKNQGFSILHHTDDIVLFADNQKCPDGILIDLLDQIQSS